LGIPAKYDPPKKAKSKSGSKNSRKRFKRSKKEKKHFFFCCGGNQVDVDIDVDAKPDQEVLFMQEVLQHVQEISACNASQWLTIPQCISSVMGNPLLKSAFAGERIQLFRPDDRDNVPKHGTFLDILARLKHARQITCLHLNGKTKPSSTTSKKRDLSLL